MADPSELPDAGGETIEMRSFRDRMGMAGEMSGLPGRGMRRGDTNDAEEHPHKGGPGQSGPDEPGYDGRVTVGEEGGAEE